MSRRFATDFAGLWNDYVPHQYLSFAAHVNDVYYTMVAVRKAFANLFTN
ncbi:hypothetical protein EYZ11_005392 [Aspergillus tanneri]|uniref:Uncharacterized protein n=1 Tax=Aspergillus tanneri TaxID=1220188 RepID=A0A4S3JKG8_9EURO|nr:hypothetical protein EYZ11_005392 [Aspergillus tanneri]